MSPRALFNIVLFLALGSSAVLNWTLWPDAARPNVEFSPDMAHSPRYAAYAANPNFPDGKTLQAPVPGTIPRGFLPLHYLATPQDALRAGEELTTPVAASDPRVLERGAVVFSNFCQTCHGPAGLGNGPVAQRGFPPPPSLRAEKALKMKDGQMFHVLTYGQGNMPSYASQLSRQDRWMVITYVRSLQKPAPETVKQETAGAAAPPTTPTSEPAQKPEAATASKGAQP